MILLLDVRQPLAAVAAECIGIPQLGAAVGAVAQGPLRSGRVPGLLGLAAEALIQRARLLLAVHDVEGGVPFFARGVLEIVDGLDDAHDNEQHAEDGEGDGRPHGGGGYGPEDAEDHSDDGAEGSHG